MNQIFICGYAGHTPDQLYNLARQLGARVLDIRLKPYSRLPGWSVGELVERFGWHYMGVPELGNAAKRDGGPMRLDEPRVGLEVVQVVAENNPVILLCCCANPAECHRRLVADLLRADGYDVRELEWSRSNAGRGDVVVTVPKNFQFAGLRGLAAWVAEGDLPGEGWSGQDSHFWCGCHAPNIQPGERVYVVCEGRLRGYAPLTRIETVEDWAGRQQVALVRRGDAVAVTIDEPITGFRGFRYRWWPRENERPFPDWRKA